MSIFKNIYTVITIAVVFAVTVMLSYNWAKADVLALDSVEVKMDIETKEAVGNVNLKLVDKIDVNFATDETLTLGLSLTKLFKVGGDNINVYVERVHDINQHLIKDGHNVLGAQIKF